MLQYGEFSRLTLVDMITKFGKDINEMIPFKYIPAIVSMSVQSHVNTRCTRATALF